MEKQIAIYTCLIGAYDDLFKIDNIYKEDDIADYYYITDNKNLKVEGYQMIYIDIIDNDKKMTQRYYKLMIPDFVKKNYKYSIYYDGNVKVDAKLKPLIEYVGNNSISVFSYVIPFNVHTQYLSKYVGIYPNSKIYKNKYYEYINNGWKDDKLNPTTKFVIRKHSEKLFNFQEEWFQETKIIGRDEFSFLYLTWKHKLDYQIINGLELIRYFSIFNHRNEDHVRHHGFNSIISPTSFSNIKKILLSNRFFDKILNIIYISIFKFFNILLQFVYFLMF